MGTISLSPESERVMFVDNLLLYRSISSPSDFLFVQNDIANVEGWSIANFLNLNLTKCKYMVLSRKRVPLVPETTLKLSN